MSAPITASAGEAIGSTGTPTSFSISLANFMRLAWVGLYALIFLSLRTAQNAGTWAPACQPEPKIAITEASCRAIFFAASALVTATRMR